MNRFRIFAAIILGALLTVSATVLTPSHVFAGGANCSADPSTIVIGGVVHITCSGFDPNTIVNSYVVEATGFSEVGLSNYAACLAGQNAHSTDSSKTNELGNATFTWYTQDGKDSCPFGSYNGYANQLGTYTVVIQELDGKGGIKYAGTTNVTITGNGNTVTGALLGTNGPAISGGTLTVYGAGFAPNEAVNIWFTRPQSCSGLGDWYYTGVSAFDPSLWTGGGVSGAGSVKADSSGAFSAVYLLSDGHNAYPCIGTWHVTAHALGSGRGGETTFEISGNAVSENAKVWTAEARVPSNGNITANCTGKCGIAVHVYGSGFPAGSRVNCWFTRPDGTVYHGYGVESYGTSSAPTVGADGTFSGLTLTYSANVTYQGEQPGTWAVTCGTPDGKYVGIAHFVVYPLPFIDP